MKKICDNIIKNRFLIAILLLITFSIIGFLINYKNNTVFSWIVNTNTIFSPWLNLKVLVLFLSGYEIFLIITDNNKNLSFLGSIILIFSNAVAYNLTKIDSLVLGFLIVVLLNKLLKEESNRNCLINAFFIILLCLSYSYTFVPYAVSFRIFVNSFSDFYSFKK